MTEPHYFESHCHLHYLKDPEGAIQRAKSCGIEKFMTVSVDIPSISLCRTLSESHSEVYFSSGVHPHEAKEWTKETADSVVQGLNHPKCKAVGETGLDFYYNHSAKDIQLEAFRAHLQIAKKVKKPLIIHCREARTELGQILSEEGPFPASGVIHCFVETQEFANKLFDLNLVIGITGIITFKNAESLRDVVKEVPLEKILIETDTPYLAPVPHRGKENEPAFIVEVAKQIAKVKKISIEEVATQTYKNAQRLFGL